MTGLATPSPAWAHASLVYASPADQQTLQESPDRLRLQFTEAVSATAGGIRLYDAAGQAVPLSAPTHPPADQTTVDVLLAEPLPDGGYALSWRVVSADSHPVSGALTFTVGTAGTAAASNLTDTDSAAAGWAYGSARWLGFAALAVLIGSAFFLVHAWPAGARRPAARRLLWTGWGASLAATIATVLLYGPYLAGTSPGHLLDAGLLDQSLRETRHGHALTVRIALLLAFAPLIWYGLRRMARDSAMGARERVVLPIAVLATGALLAATWTAAGHSTTGTLTPAALTADVIHLVAMAVWLGGLAVLAIALLPSRDTASMRRAVPAFSRAAAVSVVALVATGVFQSWRQVRTVPALLNTTYGQMLIAKVLAVLVILTLAAAARSWVRRQYTISGRRAAAGPDPHQLYHFRRRVTHEVLLAVAVLGLSAALVTSEPASTAYGAGDDVPPPSGPPTSAAATMPGTVPFEAGSGPSGKGLVAFDLQPRRVGPTAAHVTVLDSGGRPMTVPEVTITLRLAAKDLGPLPINDLLPIGPGHYTGTTTVPLPGQWEVAITVRVSDTDQTTVRLPLTIEGQGS
ncbi:copper resistance CopC/CopD family protein [Phytohabitans houttuyneae]|uniref:copper resistance CopC/CopD family protein n=1 Tax=Phytohabitans houttuyneae TaxID=1076126 RepID=UPI001FE62D24|nr:copper resistance protein CopC [Phytohabitans houttuyneae]